MKKVGIYAGSFDPVHNGHIAFAFTALQECDLDRVFFLVEPEPRHKQGVKAYSHRIEMVKRAIGKRTELATIELHQARFSVDTTLPQLQSRFKGAEITILMGDDVLGHLTRWPHVAHLLDAVSFLIGARLYTTAEIDRTVALIEDSRGIRLRHTVVRNTYPRISSQAVRAALRHGHTPRSIDSAVLAYIRQNKLYASGNEVS